MQGARVTISRMKLRLSPLVQRALTVLVGLVIMGVALKVPAASFADIGVPDGKTILGMGGFGLVTWAIRHFADKKEKRIAVAEARISAKLEAQDPPALHEPPPPAA